MFESISFDMPRPTGCPIPLSLAAPLRTSSHVFRLTPACWKKLRRYCTGSGAYVSGKPKYCFVFGLYVLFRDTCVIGPSFFVTSWTRSVTGSTCLWNDDGG